MISAIAIFVVFAAFAALMYARKMPAILAVPLMAVVMALAAGVPVHALGGIVVDGAGALSKAYVAVIFGALLGRVTLDTGIARALVNLAAEYGGEKPFGLALVLCAIVALLFTSLNGLGAIIMVGSIVLPIMMTSGVPRTNAATLFLMAFALGFIFNIANWTFYTTFFGVTEQQVLRYAVVLAAIDGIALLAYAIVAFRRERDYAAWATPAKRREPGVPWWSLITPLLPLLLYIGLPRMAIGGLAVPRLQMDATPAFALSALFGVFATRPRAAIPTLVAAAIRGVEDVAPAVLLFMGIGMLLVATKQPQFAAALHPLVAGNWIRNPIAYVAVFGVLSPLVLYRGPLNPFGVGIAIFTVLLASHALPPIVLVAAVMAVVQVQNVCDPTNTQNVWVANFTGVPIDTITKRTLPVQVSVAIAASLAVVLATQPLLGVRAFAGIVPPASAQTLSPGLEAPLGAAERVAVGDEATPLGRSAADAVVATLRGGALQPFFGHHDPDARDCSRKNYAAYVRVVTSSFALIEGTDFDVGLVLEDCGGWIVGEWHDHELLQHPPSARDAVGLARQGAARLLEWAAASPVRSSNLFLHGLAFTPTDPPTYFYSLFKTDDGNMRAYVRAGGPAYDAGLRTGDVVEELDGKAWWEYGTYQTQSRAYDGKPHSFEVERAGKTFAVQLGLPFAPNGS